MEKQKLIKYTQYLLCALILERDVFADIQPETRLFISPTSCLSIPVSMSIRKRLEGSVPCLFSTGAGL